MRIKMEDFISPIGTRYPSPEISPIWSFQNKVIEMRKLWLLLAQFQKELGVESISEEGLKEMSENITNINKNNIDEYERRLKHDIMAHIHAFRDLCPNAKWIHLGVTSNFINDNVDMILIKNSLNVIFPLCIQFFQVLKDKSIEYKSIPTLAYTHLQRAQLITIGKRFTMWNADVVEDIISLKRLMEELPFRGVKGTVGSEDTILKIFKGDVEKCKQLNNKLGEYYGFERILTITGQTYSRKEDVKIFQSLSNISQTLYKIMNDIRLLSSKMEIYESFSKQQIGSSAMPYKKNPIQCEQICSLCRFIIQNNETMIQTYINQWLERSLDDSAIKRIIYPETFMLLEYLLKKSINVMSNLSIKQDEIDRNIGEHMLEIMSEEVILKGIEMGYDRQELHERIRVLFTQQNSLENKNEIWNQDSILFSILEKYDISTNPLNYIGKCQEQIDEFYVYIPEYLR